MACEPAAHLGVLVGGVIVEDHMDRLVGRYLAFDGIEKADEFLVPVTLHAAPDDLAFPDVEGGEQGGGTVALVVVGHGGAASFLHRQTGLGAIEGLDLALLVETEHDGVGWRIDIETDDLLELLGEFGIVGELERAHPMRLEPVPLPDAPHRGRADPHRLGHRRRAPMDRLMRRRLVGQGHDPIDGRGRQGRDARGSGLVAGEPLDPLMHEAFLPAPDHGFALADSARDRGRALAISGQNNDLRPPDVLLRAVAIPDDRLQASPIRRRDIDDYSLAHAVQSHSRRPEKTLIWTLPSGVIDYVTGLFWPTRSDPVVSATERRR